MQTLPDIAVKCRAIVDEDKDAEYKLCCLSVDDLSFSEFAYKQAPQKPTVVLEFEQQTFNQRREYLKANPDFWTNPSSPAAKWMNEERAVMESNDGHKYNLKELKRIFIKNRDEARFKKVNAMLAGFPKIVVVSEREQLPAVLKQFDAKLVNLGTPNRKVFGYDQ